jgi:signal transduction histidine kinase
MAFQSSFPISFWLRTVRIGIQVTVLAVVALAVSLLLPHSPEIRTGPYVAILVAAASGTVVVVRLPWVRLLERGVGIPFLYAWSVMDIVLVSLAIWVTGGGHSDLFVLYALTTVFFGTSYPLRGQVALLCLTFACYLSVLALTGWDVTPSGVFLRLATMTTLAFLTSFLSRELRSQMEAENDSRARAERWASFLTTIAHAARSMTLDPGRVVEVALDSVMAMGFDGAALCAMSEGGETFRTVQARGAAQGYAGRTFPTTEGVAGLVLRTGETTVVDDYATSEVAIPEIRGTGFHAVVGTPIWVQGWLTAVLIGGTAQKHGMDRQEVEAFELLAAGAGMALENARKFEEEHRSVERLEELDRMKGDFLATVSHELRTPLTVIQGVGLTLERTWDSVDDQTRRHLLSGLTSNAKSLEGLITNLLDFSRLEAGRFDVHFGRLELSEVIERTATRLMSLFSEHPLVVEVEPGLVVEADSAIIERVLENLLTNAEKHTPKGTEITLSARRDGDAALVVVSDVGPGIPAEELVHLGERFFRGGDVNTRTTKGLGLGLALVREGLQLHGSSLEIESDVGVGSRFSFRLPASMVQGDAGDRAARRAS